MSSLDHNEMWKVTWSAWLGRGRKKPEPKTSQHRAGSLSTELRGLMESKVILLSSYVTGEMHTARISTVEVIVNSDKLIKMMNFDRNFELGFAKGVKFDPL